MEKADFSLSGLNDSIKHYESAASSESCSAITDTLTGLSEVQVMTCCCFSPKSKSTEKSLGGEICFFV